MIKWNQFIVMSKLNNIVCSLVSCSSNNAQHFRFILQSINGNEKRKVRDKPTNKNIFLVGFKC